MSLLVRGHVIFSFQQHEFMRESELPALQASEIETGGQIGTVEEHSMLSGFHHFISKHFHFTAQEIEYR